MDKASTKAEVPPVKAYISAGRAGKVLSGLCAFLSALAFGAYAIAMAIVRATTGPLPSLWQTVLFCLVLVISAVASVFLLLLAISFVGGGLRWVDPLLRRTMPVGAAAVIGIVAVVLAMVGAAIVGATREVYVAWAVVAWAIAVPTVILIRGWRKRKISPACPQVGDAAPEHESPDTSEMKPARDSERPLTQERVAVLLLRFLGVYFTTFGIIGGIAEFAHVIVLSRTFGFDDALGRYGWEYFVRPAVELVIGIYFTFGGQWVFDKILTPISAASPENAPPGSEEDSDDNQGNGNHAGESRDDHPRLPSAD